jgi:hypothetical protein
VPSYHDLYITTEGLERTSIFNLPFNILVQCSRVGGWQVWHKPDPRGDYVLLAGEFDPKWLVLDVAGHVIVDSRKDHNA